jgi:hypothetical protein
MRHRLFFLLFLIFGIQPFLLANANSQQNEELGSDLTADELKLFEAIMCEDIYASAPRNPSIVFSIAKEKAVCFSSFDPVPTRTVIYHNWFHRDIPSAKIRLILKPPRWSIYSSIQLRRTDIGPWRVEITKENGSVLGILRFSVTD